MPDFKVSVRTAINLLTGPFLLSGTSSVIDDEGGNGSRRRVSPRVLAALQQSRRRRPIYVGTVEDEDEPLAVLRAMGML